VSRGWALVRDGESLTPDHEGVEFASTHEARLNASRALAEMVKAMPDGPRTAIAIEAGGENREPLFKVQIVFEVAPLA